MQYTFGVPEYQSLPPEDRAVIDAFASAHGVDITVVEEIIIDEAENTITFITITYERDKDTGRQIIVYVSLTRPLHSHPLPHPIRRHRGIRWRIPKPDFLSHPYIPSHRRGPSSAFSNPLEVHYTMASITVRDSDPNFTATVALTDAKGFPTTPDDTPVWATSDATAVALVSTSIDGLSATFSPVAPGSADVTFSTTDADGVKVVGIGSATVTPGEAVKVDINFTPGEPPAPIPAPAPEPTPEPTPPPVPVPEPVPTPEPPAPEPTPEPVPSPTPDPTTGGVGDTSDNGVVTPSTGTPTSDDSSSAVFA